MDSAPPSVIVVDDPSFEENGTKPIVLGLKADLSQTPTLIGTTTHTTGARFAGRRSTATPGGAAQKSSPHPGKESTMSDPLTRDELAARLEAVEARTDAKFKELLGEIKTSNAVLAGKIDVVVAKSAGKLTVWGAALTVVGILIGAVLVFGQSAQTGYDSGWNARGEIVAATAGVEKK